MKNILKIDGIEYIKLSKFKELEKGKEELNSKDYFIKDPSNVCCIVPIKKGEEVDEINVPAIGLFKKVDNPKITLDYTSLIEGEVLTINGTRISKEYVEQIKKIASVWFSYKPEIFMVYNKDKKEFEKDFPVMFLFDYSMCFVIAPRIEGEE